MKSFYEYLQYTNVYTRWYWRIFYLKKKKIGVKFYKYKDFDMQLFYVKLYIVIVIILYIFTFR